MKTNLNVVYVTKVLHEKTGKELKTQSDLKELSKTRVRTALKIVVYEEYRILREIGFLINVRYGSLNQKQHILISNTIEIESQNRRKKSIRCYT